MSIVTFTKSWEDASRPVPGRNLSRRFWQNSVLATLGDLFSVKFVTAMPGRNALVSAAGTK
jgi:hypothetical protein